ncbi:flavin reductase family protein, partial [Streptomyces sp. NPDC000188]|uniref:flavin reductase family protein n=1 Tax=Streptomyces sp. NPDC000188 TaxID=3154245 RepID=UPI00331B5BD0
DRAVTASARRGRTWNPAAFDCRLADSVTQGTHQVLFGAVVASAVSGAHPLVHHARTYATPSPLNSLKEHGA